MAISEVNELFLAEVSCHPFRSAPGRSLTDVFFFWDAKKRWQQKCRSQEPGGFSDFSRTSLKRACFNYPYQRSKDNA